MADEGEYSVTRRVLPGFFLILDKMLGPDLMAEMNSRSRAIVERLAGGREDGLDWRQVYAEPECKLVVLDAMIAMAPYFEDVEKRKHWFLPIINGNLSGGGEWTLTDQGYYNMVDGLFDDLRHALRDPAERNAIATRHGNAACINLDRILENMNTTLVEWE